MLDDGFGEGFEADLKWIRNRLEKIKRNKRPNFGSLQVCDFEEIEIGKSYFKVNCESETRIKILAMRFADVVVCGAPRKRLIFSCNENGIEKEESSFLADMSIEPYEDGTWNGINFLEKILERNES